MENEQQIKEQMSQRAMPDHFEVSQGSAARGSNVTLKVYYDSLNIDEAQKKIENTLKIRQYLIDKGVMQ